jgi:hypothetical protein
MKLTFRQIKDLRDKAGLHDLDIEDYARQQQASDRENDWSSGYEGSSTFKHLGLGLANVHENVGKKLASFTGASDETGATASRLGSTVALAEGGAAIGSIVPGLGTAVGGLIGAGIGGLMTAAETYEQTDSGKAALVTGALGLALPAGAGALGRGLATSAAKGLGNKLVTNTAGQQVFKNLSARAFQLGGQNTGFAAGNVLTQGLTNAVASEPGQRMAAFSDAFAPANLGHAALIQGLFAAPGAYKAFKAPVVSKPYSEFTPSQQLSYAEMGALEKGASVTVQAKDKALLLPKSDPSKFAKHKDTTIRFDESFNMKHADETFTQAWEIGATNDGLFGKVTEASPEVLPHLSPGELETVKLNRVRASIGGAESVYRSFMWHSQDAKTGKTSLTQTGFSKAPVEGLGKVQTLSSVNEATNLFYEQSLALAKTRTPQAADPALAAKNALATSRATYENSKATAIRLQEKLATIPLEHPERSQMLESLSFHQNQSDLIGRQLEASQVGAKDKLVSLEAEVESAKVSFDSAKEAAKKAAKGERALAVKNLEEQQALFLKKKFELSRQKTIVAQEEAAQSNLPKVEESTRMNTKQTLKQEAEHLEEQANQLAAQFEANFNLANKDATTTAPSSLLLTKAKSKLFGAKLEKSEKPSVPVFDGSETIDVQKPVMTYGKELVSALTANRERSKEEGPLQVVVATALENSAKSKRSSNPTQELKLPSQLELDFLKTTQSRDSLTGNTDALYTESGFAKAVDDLSVFRHLVPELDTTAASHAEVINFALAKRTNSAVEMAQLHYALKMAGLHGAENLKLTARLLSMWKHKTKFNLFEDAVNKHGAFTQNKGLNEVWLNAVSSKKVKNGLLFTLTHELNGHGIWAAHEKGELPVGMSKSLSEFVRAIEGQTEKENSAMLREVYEGLPAELKRDIKSNDLLNIAGKNSEEVLSNFNALVSLSMASASQKQQGFLAMAAPGPIRPVLSAMARFSKGILDSLNTARKPSVEIIQYKKALGEFFKIDEHDAQGKEIALRLNGIQDGGQWHEMFQQNNPAIATMMKQPGVDQVVKYLEISPGEKSRWYDKTLQPIQLFGQKFPVLRKVLFAFQERQNSFNRYQTENYQVLGLKREHNVWKADKGSDYYQVASSTKMSEALNAVVQRANSLESRVSDSLKDADIAGALGKLAKGEQDQVLNAISVMEQLQQKNVGVVRDMRYDDLANLAALVAVKRGAHTDSEIALNEAKQYIADLRTKGTSSTKPVYEELVAQQMKRYEEDFAYHTSRPWYVSQQRFSEFKFRAIKKDKVTGKLSEEFNGDATTEKQLLAMMEQRKQDGWEVKRVSPTSGIRTHKELLTGLLAQEQAQAAYLKSSLELVIKDPAEVASMMSKFNMAELLVKEVAAQEKPMGLHRKGVDGFQNLDVIKQQLFSVDITGRALTKKLAKSQFELFASDSKVANHESLAHVREAFGEFLTPDHRMTQKVNALNYGMYMSLHLLNMVQDGLAPLVGVLPSNLFNEGSTMVGAYGKVLRGMSKAVKHSLNPKKLSKPEQDFLAEFETNNDALSLYTDGANNEVMSAINARRAVDGQPLLNAAQFIGEKGAAMFATAKGWHGAFTHFGHKTTALALFEHFTEKGMKFEDAKKAAFESFALNTFSGGKANRIGLMAPGKAQPFMAMFTGLQNFALGTMFTAKNHFSKAFLRSGMSSAERLRATGALGMQMGALWAVAGLFGMPGVGPATKVLQDQFGINAKLELEDFFQDSLGIQGSLATEGLLNSLTGSDVASRSSASGLFGISDKSFALNAFGPTGSLAAKVYGLGDGSSEWQDLMPSPLNRLISMYKDSGDFRDSKGNLLEEGNFNSNLIYGAFGIKPTSVREKQDYKSLVYASEKNEQRRKEQFEEEAIEALERGEDISGMLAAFQETENANQSRVKSQLMNIASPELKSIIQGQAPTKIVKPAQQQRRLVGGIQDTLFKMRNFAVSDRPTQEQRELFLGGKLDFAGFAR